MESLAAEAQRWDASEEGRLYESISALDHGLLCIVGIDL
jgi:hypothetical protein